ncbi:MAG: hypothetical protein J7577_20105 [Sphingobacteriaceae bacterium]|nr:hypothetical protein [Sphingobacteriaceae bacterium]
MRIIIYILLVFFVISCSVNQNYSARYCKVSYSKEDNYVMDIFCESKLTTLIGGHGELEKQYSYQDSSKIYITNFICSMLNYNNVLNLGDSISNIRLKDLELTKALLREQEKLYVPDTLVLQGVTKQGLFWKDIRMGSISIGYVNVSVSKKELFDKMLNTLKKR